METLVVSGTGKVHDLWEAVIRCARDGNASIKDTRTKLTFQTSGYGRCKFMVYSDKDVTGQITLDGEYDDGMDLSFAAIKLVGEKRESRTELEQLIKSSRFFNTKRSPKDGGYMIEYDSGSSLDQRLEKAIRLTSKRRTDGLMPFVSISIEVQAEGESSVHARTYSDMVADMTRARGGF